MSMAVRDISGALRNYLLSKTGITSLVGQRIFTPKFPTNSQGVTDNEQNPKIAFRQIGGSPSGSADYRYMFIVRADSDLTARTIASEVINQLIESNFSLADGDGNNISWWAELDSSMNDSTDEQTNQPETFFNINFSSIQ